jgi:hypothetical protein
METQMLLLCSTEPTTNLYPELDELVHTFQSYFFKVNFNIILPLTHRFSRWFFVYVKKHVWLNPRIIAHVFFAKYVSVLSVNNRLMFTWQRYSPTHKDKINKWVFGIIRHTRVSQ